MNLDNDSYLGDNAESLSDEMKKRHSWCSLSVAAFRSFTRVLYGIWALKQYMHGPFY